MADQSENERSRVSARRIDLPAPAVLALLYGALIFFGAALLSLPIASHYPLSFDDAVFTATSAVTVTGLTVVSVGNELTFFGQFVVALLIQLGGLGLMTFAALVLASLGLPLGLPTQFYLQEDLGQTSIARVLSLVFIIAKLVGVALLVGTVLLMFRFVPDFGWALGTWTAFFHAVSAFNNAGFSTFDNSLMDYVADPIINMVVPLLFIVGGIGFAVIADIAGQKKWRKFTLHTKIMLAGTAILIGFAFLMICLLEWGNPATLGGLDTVGAKLTAGWFQAVTPRTAGFNTVDTGGMTDGALFFTMILMFIGGGATSTAGGIKVTTAAVLLFATYAFFRRNSQVHVFHASVSAEKVLSFLALATVAGGVLMTAAFFLIATQSGGFKGILFEAVSAFGTVGLSTGETSALDSVGRTIVCFLMFLGRVGPLTLGFFLATSSPPRIRFPKGDVQLG